MSNSIPKTFWTDREIERFLKSISRKIELSDGTVFHHTNFSLYWDKLDYLVTCHGVKPIDVVERARSFVNEGAIIQDGFRWAISEFYFSVSE